MKKSKNYQKIISQLDNLYIHVSEMAKAGGDEIWSKDKKALQEAIGIIDDYEKATEQAALLVQRYEVGAKVVHRGMSILAIAEPTEDDILYWRMVFKEHAEALGENKKEKTDNQIRKWLQDPESDSAKYKMWGNGIALPCAEFVMRGIAKVLWMNF